MNIDFDKSVNVFTDASVVYLNGKSVSCSGYVIVYKNRVIDASFRIFNDSSNNYGEVFALYIGLKAAVQLVNEKKYDYRINLISDSQISVYGLRDWIFAWCKKMKNQSLMISSAKKPISNQYFFKCIVKTIVHSKIPVYIYHQLGHISNTSENLNRVVKHFKRVNLENIDDDMALKIIFYNNFIDRYTRNNLLTIVGSPVFDVEKYKKEEENDNEILTKEDMVVYGALINKIKPCCCQVNDDETSCPGKAIASEECEIKDASEPEKVISVEQVFIERPKKETVSLTVGEIIVHRKFGKGVVTFIQDGEWFDACFENIGSKSLVWNVFDMEIAKIVK